MRRSLLWGLLTAAAIVLTIASDLRYHWSSYSWYTVPFTPEQIAEEQRSIWDWLDLLLVPLVLATGGLLFSWNERRTERAIAQERAEQERAIAEQRADRERVIAAERAGRELQIADETAQEAALQSYLEQMSTLLIDKELRKSSEGDEIRSVARAWTLTVLRRVKSTRKGAVLRFLYESHLIDQDETIISLEGANFEEVYIPGVYLAGVYLFRAHFQDAYLWGADFSEAYLKEALLSRSFLVTASLWGADLTSAHLEEADLEDANFEGANLRGASLVKANLAGANLISANFENANLVGANLEEANLWGANLKEAHISATNLRNTVYDEFTIWPEGFNPIAAGALLISEKKDLKRDWWRHNRRAPD